MSYSYPPLLYQRGDDSEEEYAGEDDEDESNTNNSGLALNTIELAIIILHL